MATGKLVVVKKPTLLEEMLARHATKSHVRFHLESRGDSFAAYKEAHDAYHAGLASVVAAVPRSVRLQVLEREMLPTYQAGEDDLIAVVGDPGLVANTAKYVNGRPIIAVNPDARRYEDTFATCTPSTFSKYLGSALNGGVQTQGLTMAEAKLEDGQTILGFNDLFIGRRTHVSARYEIQVGATREQQSSSGIIIATGSGSTGWMTSIFRGAERLSGSTTREPVPFPRDADYLLFAVREAFPSKATQTSIAYGRATKREPLKIRSAMPEDGVIFSDGIEAHYLQFNAGSIATVQPASVHARLVLP